MTDRRDRTTRRLLALLLCGCSAFAAAGCAAVSDDAFEHTSRALRLPPPEPPEPESVRLPDQRCGAFASLRPRRPLPAPGRMPAGTYMRSIEQRGRLIVGVDQNTVPLAYFNPLTRRLEGFEIDLIEQVARAIFGSVGGRIEFRAISTAQRIDVVRDGSVDLVADAIAINCERRRQVSFTTAYYAGGHSLMVLKDSGVRRLRDVRGKTVCATAGSISIGYIARRLRARPFPMPMRTDCLVALQQRRVAAISTSEAFLAGFADQDPLTRIVGRPYTSDVVAMAIARSHPGFVRFVNAVLERSRADGSFARSHERWLGRRASPPPRPRYRDR